MLLSALSVGAAPTSGSGESAKGEHTVDLLGQGEGYSAVLYDNTNGLPTSEANTIAETKDGFLWIGSYGGLIRYDGSNFERISSTTGVSSVVCLYVDSRDRLWIGTNDSGVAVMEQDELRVYNKSDGLRSLFVCSITEDPKGNIYVGTTQGVARINTDGALQILDEPQINNEYVQDLSVGADGVIYGRTTDGSALTISEGKLTGFYNSGRLGIAGMRCVVPDRENPGSVYFGTSHSEIYYGSLAEGAQTLERIDISPLQYVNDIVQVGDQLWICADNGIGLLADGSVKRFEELPLNSSVECMLTDYQGNLWFASSKQGVMKIVPNQFTDVFDHYGIKPEVVNTTCLYRDMLLIGRKSNGLIAIDANGIVESVPLRSAVSAAGEPIEAEDLNTLLEGSQIRSMSRDNQGRLWIASYGKNPLILYNGATATCFSIEDGLPTERGRAVVERGDGSYMAAMTGGLVLIRSGKVEAVYGEDAGIQNTEILTAAEAENGDMIVGTDGNGIYVLSDKKVLHVGIDDGLASEVVMRVKKDRSRDLFWIVTSNSIAYMDEHYRVTTVKQFPYSNNFDLYENSVGEMWVLSSNGIYVADVDQLLANGELDTVHYNRHNGLSCIATANSYSELTDDGMLYIAGTTGVARVNIDEPFESVEEVKMSVPFVEADGERYYADKGAVTIPSYVRKLTIYSHVFTYSLMDPQVTFWLDGFDRTQTTLRRSEMGPVDYTNLHGGSYRFMMQLHDSHGNGSRDYSVRIIKQKAIYEQIWFIALCVLAAIALVAGIVMLINRRRTQQLLKRQAEQKEFINEVTEVLAKTIDMKDKYTNGHSIRVARYTEMLARELGCDDDTVDKFYNIALLHDIGKISVPPEVLNKNGRLEDDEFKIIKSHAALGYETLKDIRIMPELAVGAGSHHERPDGNGYPNGLKGDEIPRVAQIIAVADTFDAMYSDRPYRKRMNFDKVVDIMKSVSGTQLTPDVVEAFLRLVDKGKLRSPNDHGGGSMEDIDNIHRRFEEEKDQENISAAE